VLRAFVSTAVGTLMAVIMPPRGGMHEDPHR
jgi:hypothetical protein